MAVFRPFKALRPLPAYASRVAALPYDVMTSEEAREMVKDNPYSFLHVDKAEIDLPEGTDPYSDAVYEKAAENLHKLESDGICKRDEIPHYYIYRQTMNGREQTGLVGCASVDDYLENRIKKHELTRAEKEADRVRHVDTCDANTGPIFLCYRGKEEINSLIAAFSAAHAPAYDFVSDGVGQTVWVVDDDALCTKLEELLGQVEAFYIADGHHRCASAVRVAQSRRKELPDYTGKEEFNFFLSVLFPAESLQIMDYNRLVKDLNGMQEFSFFRRLDEYFTLALSSNGAVHPDKPHTFGMYLPGQWYRLTAKEGTFDACHPVARLDVSILQQNLLVPLLHVGDPRVDKRIDFVGGIRGLEELEKRVDSGEMAVAFSLYPTTTDDLIAIADAKRIMPPKSTWFEPKLLSGLFVHFLETAK